MGTRGGVIAHLQSEAGSHIIPIHCMPHRLELAILTLQKTEPKVAVVYDLLHLIWKTYHFSGKSKRELYNLGQELGVDICSPSSVKGTRWIPHIHRALKVFLRHGQGKDLASDPDQYSVVLQHMEHLAASASTSSEVQGRAKKIKMKMESTLFCVFCHFLCDLFEELATLSLTLQKNDLILPQATSELKKTVTRLEALKINPKPGGLLEKVQTSFAQQRGDEMSFQGMKLKGNVTCLKHPQLKRHVEAAISISVDAIKARFGGLVKNEGIQTILDSFRVLNPDTWPEEQANLLTFGDDSIADLVKHFEKPLTEAGCKIATIQDEWQGLKILVSQNFRDKTYSGLREMLLTKDPYKQDYKNILELVQIRCAMMCDRDLMRRCAWTHYCG
ncbi:zinc finger protein 862-like [Sinocyclocheilus grahami]|uniref:zinc finger protein 862-like n=1 Tax=Sinocyclocheilus grahami TaxID=75366 RepID=UPI0007AD5161|nr:PREDICTED: zinc finger protein 862-like [Sinocyclocheilus grahami]